jgi:hypothetical protein
VCSRKSRTTSSKLLTQHKSTTAARTGPFTALGDVTKEAGAPVSVTGSDGKSRYPLASELADKNTKIANWRVLGKDEKPQAGDVAAYKLSRCRALFGAALVRQDAQ